MIILGIDPGNAITGYGIIESKNGLMTALDFGCIFTEPGFPEGERLKKISNEFNKIIKKYNPELIAVESLYFFKNLKTAIPVSQAKGAILLTAARKNIPVYEFTPLQVKMTVTGYGRAEKKQVQKMVQTILKMDEMPKKDDAADALGVALCCFLSKEKVNLS